MDATSLVFTIIDAGMRIKASIDKLSDRINRNRRRLRDLADDTLEDLYAMKSFCVLHNPDLTNAPELKTSLVKLHNKLLNVASKCDRTLIIQSKRKVTKIVRGFKSWKDADDVESEVSRLREVIQGCMNRIQLYVAVRSELAIARVEHSVLVLTTDIRANIGHFDEAFGASICGSNSAEFTPLLQHCASDGYDIQYLRLKLHDIADNLETTKFSFVDTSSFQIELSLYTPIYPAPIDIISIIESSLVPIWRVIRSLQSGTEIPLTRSFLDTVSKLNWGSAQHGINSTTYRIWAIVGRIFRGIMETDHDERLLPYFSWMPNNKELVLSPRKHLACTGKSGSPGCLATHSLFCPRENILFAQERVDICRKLCQSPSQTYPRSHRLIWLQQAIDLLAWAHHYNGDNDAAISRLQEALRIYSSLDDCGIQSIPIIFQISQLHCFGPSPLQTFVQDYPVAQNTACLLASYAFVLESCGRYSDAFYIGRDSLTIIDALRDKADELPSNFDFFDADAMWLRASLPTWVEIVRNPAIIEDVDEMDEDTELESSVSHDNVEWGIAI